MAQKYSKEWRENVAKGVKASILKNGISESSRKLRSENMIRINKLRKGHRKPIEEMKSWTKIRVRVFEERGRDCSKCGWNKERHDGIIPTQINHKDGDRTNNHPDNLEVLCPNCHSLTEKFMFYGGSHRR